MAEPGDSYIKVGATIAGAAFIGIVSWMVTTIQDMDQRLTVLTERVEYVSADIQSRSSNRLTSSEHKYIEQQFVADLLRIEREIKEMRSWIRDLERTP